MRRIPPQKNTISSKETEETYQEPKQENMTPIVVSDDDEEAENDGKKEKVAGDDERSVGKTRENEESSLESATFEKEKAEEEEAEEQEVEEKVVEEQEVEEQDVEEQDVEEQDVEEQDVEEQDVEEQEVEEQEVEEQDVEEQDVEEQEMEEQEVEEQKLEEQEVEEEAEEEEETERKEKTASPEASHVENTPLPENSKAQPHDTSSKCVQNPDNSFVTEEAISDATPLKQDELYKIIGIAMSTENSSVKETVPAKEYATAEDPDIVYVHDSTTDEEDDDDGEENHESDEENDGINEEDVDEEEEGEEEEEKELQALFEEDEDCGKPDDVQPLGSDIVDAAMDSFASSTSSDVVEVTPMNPVVDTIVIDENALVLSDESISSGANSNNHGCKRKHDDAVEAVTTPAHVKRRYSCSTDVAADNASNLAHAENLEQRMLSYVNVQHITCNHCELKFPEMEALRAHMALHFNWYRYQCDLCPFKCYQKGPTFTHVINKHKIRTAEQIEAAIFDIPEWKSARYSSTTFIEILAQSAREDYDEPPAFLAVEVKVEDHNDDEDDKGKLLRATMHMKKEEDDDDVEMFPCPSSSANCDSPRLEGPTIPEERLCDDDDEEDAAEEDKRDLEIFPGSAANCDSSLDLKLSDSSLDGEPTIPAELPEERVRDGDDEEAAEEEEKKDPETFKMVMEVIFGSTPQPNAVVVKEESPSSPEPMDDSPSKESSTSPAELQPGPKVRPIRQRTPCVHKDFLYDMSSLMKGKVSKDVSSANGPGDARGVNKVSGGRKSAPKFCAKINRDVENKVQYPVVPKLRLRKCEEIYVRCEEKMDDSNS